MADKIVPIKYVGPSDSWTDHIYGTKFTWKKDGIQAVPGYIALKLLTHSEFKDARPRKMRDRPIDGTKPVREEDDLEAPLVNLEGLTKESLSQYAKRYFNLDLGERANKSEMIDKVRSQMGATRPVGY